MLLAALFQTLSLVAWFETQLCSWNNCGWSLGSVSDVCAVTIWALDGILILCHYPSSRHERHHPHEAISAKELSPGGQSPSHDTIATEHDKEGQSYDDEYEERRYPDAEMA